MRMRHTSKTDPLFKNGPGGRRQRNFRLSDHYRERIREVIGDPEIVDIHNLTDVVEDSLWLFFHEYDLMIEKGLIHRGGRATPGAE